MEEVAGSVAAATATEPLLWRRGSRAARRQTLAALLGRRRASMLVRERAALQLEERRADWGYSLPIVALDITWNLAFAVSAAVALISATDERPNKPVRVWLVGYAAQCLVHVGLVWAEYRRRRGLDEGGGERRVEDSEGNDSGEEEEEEEEEVGGTWRRRRSRFAKHCESLNTMASFLWWLVGIYWLVSGGETLMQSAPRLYRLAFLFLAVDILFAIFCMALACIIGLALCCCLPCIIAILYAVSGQEGASDADISILPRYRYAERYCNEQKTNAEAGAMVPILSRSESLANERALSKEDAECCICLTSYQDGAELHALPCSHHFHSECIGKWLRINATCPLCKYDILKGSDAV